MVSTPSRLRLRSQAAMVPARLALDGQHLAHEEDLVAPALDRLAGDLLGDAVGVHLGGVDQRHAEIEAELQGAHLVGRAWRRCSPIFQVPCPSAGTVSPSGNVTSRSASALLQPIVHINCLVSAHVHRPDRRRRDQRPCRADGCATWAACVASRPRRSRPTSAISASSSISSGRTPAGRCRWQRCARCGRADIRAFMATPARGRRSKPDRWRGACRAIKSFFRFLEREGVLSTEALNIVRTPKAKKSLPKALTVLEAKATIATTDELEDRPWVAARDMAVLSLCYGAGLRISEALALSRADLEGPTLRITGKGGKTRLVPLIDSVRDERRDLSRALPVPADAEPAAVPRRQRRRAVAAADPAARGAIARRPRPAAERHAARAAPQLCDAPARTRRRPARHPGTARPRLAVDDADLHRGRYRAAARRLSGGASQKQGELTLRGASLGVCALQDS